MGAIDPAGNMRRLDWSNPGEGLKDDEIGLSKQRYEAIEKLDRLQRKQTYAEMRNAGKIKPSMLSKKSR